MFTCPQKNMYVIINAVKLRVHYQVCNNELVDPKIKVKTVVDG